MPTRSASTKKPTRPTPAKAKVGGRAGTAGKADGDGPVKAFITALPAWQREIARRFDALVGREVPDVQRAVKWSVPFYGREGQGWFASFGAFSKHVKVLFFKGTLLKPPPPNGDGKEGRSLDLKDGDAFDETLIVSWIRQASKMPGWGA